MTSEHETIFTMEATPVKFGAGASRGREPRRRPPRAGDRVRQIRRSGTGARRPAR
jgi:hypothetical protein